MIRPYFLQLSRTSSWTPVAISSFLFALVILVFPYSAYALPANFQETTIWSGLAAPVAVAFAPNGKVFIAEKDGIIKVFDGPQDTTATIFADLRTEVQSFSDRGLLGLAVDPQFPTRPYVYALYTLDAPIGQVPPVYNDNCPQPDNCKVGSRLVKLTANGNVMSGKQTLIEGWCQIENSHSVGTLKFGPDGALYVSHGEGASYNHADYGQDAGGCPDPVNEGGALRSQDLQTAGDAVGLDGTLLRINPDTGAAFAGNPLIANGIADDDRIIAYGMRNPFRFTIDPTSNALWIGDVGWGTWEEIDYIPNPTSAPIKNFGWPCFEGPFKQPVYDALNLPICENLYANDTTTKPYYSFDHNKTQAAISAVALYRGTQFPAAYNGALFFADVTRNWIKVMMPGTNGLPNINNIQDFAPLDVAPVYMEIGPTGDLVYADINTGTVRSVKYFATNSPPVARIVTNTTTGPVPLTVQFSGTTSSDPDVGDTRTYAWDLDNDGAFDDATTGTTTRTFTVAGPATVRLLVTDSKGATSTASVVINAGNTAPTATITSPAPGQVFTIGQSITFAGSANDAETGAVPAANLSWQIILNHCSESNANECHEHTIQTLTGVSGGTFIAPEHEYPADLEFRLQASDVASGSTLVGTTSVRILPKTTTWTFTSNPSGLSLSVYGSSYVTPFNKTAIVGAQTIIAAPTPQTLGGNSYAFASWSDGGLQSHTITATNAAQTFSAAFNQAQPPPSSQTTSWNSWDIVTQAGSPQALVTASGGGAIANVELYQSANVGGVDKAALFSTFNLGAHPDLFNRLENYWAMGVGSQYPYAGKSTVGRGSDVGEGNAQAPLGVKDLQFHPPATGHLAVSALRLPFAGTYTISNIGVRRLDAQGTSTRLMVFNPNKQILANIQATNNRAWVLGNPLTITNATTGSYVYFGLERDEDYSWDASEVSFTVSMGTTTSNPPPPPPPTVTPAPTIQSFVATPGTIQAGQSTVLSWTVSNTTSLSISSIGTVVGTSATVAPAGTTPYTLSAFGPGGTTTASLTVTVNPVAPTPTTLVWNSYDILTQPGAPQGIVTAQNSNVAATVEFYESTNNYGVAKGGLFAVFNSGLHPVSYNNLDSYWTPLAGSTFPYAGKSTVNRGSDVGEGNAPSPFTVKDLQLHPPANDHLTVAAFKVPQNGTYTITKMGVRRVSNQTGYVRMRIFGPQAQALRTLTATNNRAWVLSNSAITLTNVTAGSYIYFGADRASDNANDAAEVTFTITKQ